VTTEEKKIFSGILFNPLDPELKALKLRSHKLSAQYSALYEDDVELRARIASLILGEFGEGSFMQGPIFFHYGKHTKIGKRCFFNYNLTIQDDTFVTIGDDCNFGPNVTIVTPIHPMLPDERRLMLDKDSNKRHFCYAKPVAIGKDCWFGANVVVCPGVEIGDNCVIGAGSVVTRSIPPNTFAAGNPCRVIREITQQDSMVNKPDILADNQVIEQPNTAE
jgi:acetyltransferase-like isoleucine patch superfamily enzyme